MPDEALPLIGVRKHQPLARTIVEYILDAVEDSASIEWLEDETVDETVTALVVHVASLIARERQDR